MRYISTRGQAPVLEFDEVLLAGLARDGGLYLPETWPQFDAAEIRALRGLSYAELATRIIAPFVGDRIDEAALAAIVAESYRDFGHDAVAPLQQLDANLWVMELFHGPTLAFKDFAMQFLGRAFDHVLGRRGERVTIVGATSGDTGPAAIEACRDREAIDIFFLYPHGRVSEVQRRQMTTVESANVHAIAVEGTFDDCQDLVKAMFNDTPFRDELRLSAANSINWARVMAQIVYYFHAAVSLGAPDRPVSFAVPTGNFGNVYAGYAARAMGLPIDQFIVGSNVNDILPRFFDSGSLTMAGVTPTISPSMDIQVSSNFERFLFELYGRDGAITAQAVTEFRDAGALSVGDNLWQKARETFVGHRMDDTKTKAVIGEVHASSGYLLDPHSAIAVAAARAKANDASVPVVALATAHPAKFPDAVHDASGVTPSLPPALADLCERPERMAVLPNDLARMEAYVRDHVSLSGAA
ncbi:MAG: threonine synthase [Alphaproteobacteria bacterium]|nr:threonine synthase [Alphaproteobacteria bacterium]